MSDTSKNQKVESNVFHFDHCSFHFHIKSNTSDEIKKILKSITKINENEKD